MKEINVNLEDGLKKAASLGWLELAEDKAIDAFLAAEGSANLYYGLIGSGKTYGATSDIHDALIRGDVCYATWPIKVEDFDDRESFFLVLISLFLPWKKRFYNVDCTKNFHFINAETGEVDGVKSFDPEASMTSPDSYVGYLNKINHARLWIDEAWRVIDSYKGVNFAVEGRNLVLVTRHKYREVNLISQRPTAIHVTARGNMNRFYKFVQGRSLFGIPRFLRYEFQVMSGETVDENEEPISTKAYWGKKRIFDSYNSHYYGDLEPLHRPIFKAYEYTYKGKLSLLKALVGRLVARGRSANEAQAAGPPDIEI